jgi:hypothetical protein
MRLRAQNRRSVSWLRGSSVLILFLAASWLTLLLRLRQAQAPMVFDEFASMYFSGRSFGDLWGQWLVRETNPPLFYSILKVWRMVVPESQASLRLLPLLLSLAQIGLVARFAGKNYGWLAALACILLFALSPSDIYQSDYLRGYMLAKLAITLSFIGLVAAFGEPARRRWGWTAYVVGAAIAIYSHTTLLLWPGIATAAVITEAVWRREIGREQLIRLFIADLAIFSISAWEVWIAILQMQFTASNIAWIHPLPIEDFFSSANLQLLQGGELSSVLMGGLVIAGIMRTLHERITRLSFMIAGFGLLAFKAADLVHPITTDYTLHWCATFTVLLAAAAFAEEKGRRGDGRNWIGLAIASVVLLAAIGDGLIELDEEGLIPTPQDWRYVLNTVARTPASALLVSHESIGVVVKQACMLQFHMAGCPFPLVVMQNPAASDSWAIDGYGGKIIPAERARIALGSARTVFAFSRYLYTPLAPLGLVPGDYHETEWDDGELIGPIPIEDFDQSADDQAAPHRARVRD